MRRNGEAGFTVVELLVALTLLSLVIVTLTAVFGTAQRLFAAVSTTSGELEEVGLVRRLFSESLGQVTNGRSRTAAVTGDERRLVVIALGPRVLAAVDPLVLELAPDSDRRGLLAFWRNNAADATIPWPSRRIVSPERQVRFSYFASESGWTESWTNPKQSPALVRVVIDALGDDKNTTLTFVTRQLEPPCGARTANCRSQP